MASNVPLAVDRGWRKQGAWLYSARADLGIVLTPCFMVAAVALMAVGEAGVSERAYGTWFSQFVLGNSTHVMLTFLLLAVRRDVLHATKGHARTVTLGSLTVLLGTFLTFWGLNRYFPFFNDFAFAVLMVFATHHTVSQVKGIWSLYHLRAASRGLPRATEVERRFQRMFVPVSLALIMVKWLFVPTSSGRYFAFIHVIPGMEAVLPYATTYGLLLIWLLYALGLMAELLRADVCNVAKTSYLAVHCLAVGLSLMWPPWGGMMSAGIHGLEYYFLAARMLAPMESEPAAKLTRGWVWPAMILSMLPLFAIGLVHAPFAAGWIANRPLFDDARYLLNAIVASHYFADAFIYRFRVPEIRQVALARLRFA